MVAAMLMMAMVWAQVQQERPQPQPAGAGLSVCIAASHAHQLPRAQACFSHWTRLHPRSGPAWLDWGILLAAQGQLAAALPKFRQAARWQPNHARAWTALGMDAGKAGKMKLAVQAMRHAERLRPQLPGTQLNLGIALAAAGQLQSALEPLRRAEKLDPRLAAAHYNLARVLADLDQPRAAQKEARQTLRLAPNDLPALRLLAQLARQPGQQEFWWRKVIALRPGDAKMRARYALALWQSGRPAAAVRQWRTALRLNPRLAAALYGLARAWATPHPGRAARLLARLRRLRQWRQRRDRIRFLGNSALIEARQHRFPRALAALRQGLRLCGSCREQAHLRQNLGLILCQAGQRKAGIIQLRRAYALAPDNAIVRQALRQLGALPTHPRSKSKTPVREHPEK